MKTKLTLIILFLFSHINDNYGQVTRKIHVNKAGTMVTYLTEAESNEITHLTLTGNINAEDFRHLRDEFIKLTSLDLSNAEIRMHTGQKGTSPDKIYVYPRNCIPAYAFCKKINRDWIGKESLKRVKLSDKIKNIEDGAFKNCHNLQVIEIEKKKAPNILPHAFENVNAAIFVPLGSSDNYRMHPQWKLKSIIEGTPIKANVKVEEGSSLVNELLKLGVQPHEINYLSVEGKLNDVDFKLIRNYMNNLVFINIEKTSISRIPEFTFNRKTHLIGAKLPSQLKVIGERAFSNCERLSGNVILPPTLAVIEYGAFLGCKNLKKVVITGSSLTTIGKNLFDNENSNKLFFKKEQNTKLTKKINLTFFTNNPTSMAKSLL